jgi:hypothetical protein
MQKQLNFKAGERVRLASGKAGFLLGDVTSVREVAVLQLDRHHFHPGHDDGIVEVAGAELRPLEEHPLFLQHKVVELGRANIRLHRECALLWFTCGAMFIFAALMRIR